jgi:hypothetical protein
MNKMNDKKLYYYIGGAAAAGLLYMYYKRSTTHTHNKTGTRLTDHRYEIHKV